MLRFYFTPVTVLRSVTLRCYGLNKTPRDSGGIVGSPGIKITDISVNNNEKPTFLNVDLTIK
jgi:hypothetical protein